MQQKHLLAAASIIAIWVAVLFVGVFGADFHSTSSTGDVTEIPVVWGVVPFAMGATAVAAWFGFRD